MLKIYFQADSRYKIDRVFVKNYLLKAWKARNLPEGTLGISFVGARKGRALAREYLKDDTEHPVLTFPYVAKTRRFPQETEDLVGEIVVCYPQVSLYAAEQDKEINLVISHFIDHALTIMSSEYQKT